MNISKIPLGPDTPNTVYAVIEIPKGTKNKYEYNDDMDALILDRVIHSPVVYPTNYGFIPRTKAEDGDHLDVLILTEDALVPCSIVTIRPIGVLKMADDKGIDNKIIGVIENDPKYSSYQDITDINEAFRNEIVHFFEIYKVLELKKVSVEGYGDKNEAQSIISLSFVSP